LGRIIHNGRVVRQEMKCGNSKAEKEACEILCAHSISMSSFYSKYVNIDDHDDKKVICLEEYRKKYAKYYKERNISLKTHRIMRRLDDPECHSNQYHEMVQDASV